MQARILFESFLSSHPSRHSLFSSSPIFHDTSSSHGKLPNLFLYDHLRLRKYDFCLISSISPLEEVIGNLGFWKESRQGLGF
jgi:hypothetical protein